MNVMVFLIETNMYYTGTWAVQEMYTSTLLCDSFTVYIIASDHDILMAVLLEYFHAVHHMILFYQKSHLVETSHFMICNV